MRKAFAAFVADPSGANYLAARAAAWKRNSASVQSGDIARLTALADAHQFAELMQTLDELPASAQLSPRAHYLAWMAAEKMRDDDEAELQRYLFAACLRGILETGSGSPESPFRVAHISDEYDVLLALGRECLSQQLIERQETVYDVLRCDDGQELWFECGQASTANRRRKAPSPQAAPKRRRVARSQ